MTRYRPATRSLVALLVTVLAGGTLMAGALTPAMVQNHPTVFAA